MKVKFLSVLISILWIPLSIIGQAIGKLAAEFLYGFNLYANMPDFMKISGPTILSGIAGGYLAGYIVTKIYKKLDWRFAAVLPSIFTALMVGAGVYVHIANDLRLMDTIPLLLAHIATLVTYVYVTKEKQNDF